MCLLFINTLVAPFELYPMNFLLLSYECVVMSDDDDDDDDDGSSLQQQRRRHGRIGIALLSAQLCRLCCHVRRPTVLAIVNARRRGRHPLINKCHNNDDDDNDDDIWRSRLNHVLMDYYSIAHCKFVRGPRMFMTVTWGNLEDARKCVSHLWFACDCTW